MKDEKGNAGSASDANGGSDAADESSWPVCPDCGKRHDHAETSDEVIAQILADAHAKIAAAYPTGGSSDIVAIMDHCLSLQVQSSFLAAAICTQLAAEPKALEEFLWLRAQILRICSDTEFNQGMKAGWMKDWIQPARDATPKSHVDLPKLN